MTSAEEDNTEKETEEESQELTEVQKQTINHYNKVIFPLEMLVQFVNNNPDSKIPVSLQMGGILVSGNLMALSKYYEEFGMIILEGLQQKESDTNNKERDAIRDAVKSFTDTVPGITTATLTVPLTMGEQVLDRKQRLLFDYVCIQNATIIQQSDGKSEPKQVRAWIGKLESVDAFFLE